MGWGKNRPFLNSKLVKKEMYDRGWSVHTLARKLEVSDSTVRSWLNYRTKPRDQQINALVDLIGIPPARLLVEPEKATQKMLERHGEHTAKMHKWKIRYLRRQGEHNVDVREALSKKRVTQSAIASMLGVKMSYFAKMLHERELPIAMKGLIMDYADAIKVDQARNQERLRELALHAIGSRGLTQTEVAKAAGMPIGTLSQWLTGRVMMTSKRLEVIMDAINKIEEEQHE